MSALLLQSLKVNLSSDLATYNCRIKFSFLSEHDYIKAIKAYDRELEKMKKVMKKSPDWIS